jgi:hypothetical protein
MKRLLMVLVLAVSACSPSMPMPPEPHYVITDTSGTDVIDIGMPDDKHRTIAYLDDTTMHVIKGSLSSSGMWNYDDESGKNVLDTKPIKGRIEFKVRGLNFRDPNDTAWYAFWWVRIEPTQIRIANNSDYDSPSFIQPDKVFDSDGSLLGSVVGMDVKNAAGKTVYHVKSGPPCACYGVLLMDGIPPLRRAGLLQRLLDNDK